MNLSVSLFIQFRTLPPLVPAVLKRCHFTKYRFLLRKLLLQTDTLSSCTKLRNTLY